MILVAIHVADLEARRLRDRVNNLYWTFTRCRRGRPPDVAEPGVSRRANEAEQFAQRLRRRAR